MDYYTVYYITTLLFTIAILLHLYWISEQYKRKDQNFTLREIFYKLGSLRKENDLRVNTFNVEQCFANLATLSWVDYNSQKSQGNMLGVEVHTLPNLKNINIDVEEIDKVFMSKR